MRLDPNRRQFLKNVTRTAAGVCGVGIILGLQQQQAKAKEGIALRPPGALPEKDFLAACTRCGQCVQACPTPGGWVSSPRQTDRPCATRWSTSALPLSRARQPPSSVPPAVRIFHV